MAEHTIYCLGFESLQVKGIITVLSYAKLALISPWHVVNYGDAKNDVMMINMDSDSGFDLDSERKNNSNARSGRNT